MQTLIVPEQIGINEILKKKSFSPSNYKQISIKRKSKVKMSYFLNESHPFVKGEEPGSITYVKNSKIKFLRNSCINGLNYNFDHNKLISLNPKYEFENKLNNNDVLMCKDANISDACLIIKNSSEDMIFSSGIIKLNFKEEKHKYYCLAFMNDNYFFMQLDAKTPRGSTIKHSGDKFLDCYIPLLDKKEEWAYEIIENLVKNIAHSENLCYMKLSEIYETIDKELMVNKNTYENPGIKKFLEVKRVDAGIYSKVVFDVMQNIKKYKYGYSDLESYGYSLKRGTNLQKRDLGRSLQSKKYRKNYNVLVYPSDISDGGYISETSYIGARNPVMYLKNGEILFSAEGTVGKVFIICDEKLKFITNIHGMIIYPKNRETNINKSIFLGMFLNYLRVKGVIERLTAGGQGGSLAVGYWHNILIPNFQVDLVNKVSELYNGKVELNPFEFKLEDMKSSGIFQLNNLRMIAFSILEDILSDIKQGKLKNKEEYLRFK